jgi:dethiobiotin synthetase
LVFSRALTGDRTAQRSVMPANDHAASPLALAVIGTGTAVGKTWTATLLVTGLRALGRQVWVHKPIACGDWRDGTADDGRVWSALVGDGQPPATVCPRQYPEACSPHLAAQAAGDAPTLADLGMALERARPRRGQDFVVEGAGGLLVPLTIDRETVADLAMMTDLPVLVVAHAGLGTLNHTALTIEVARGRGLDVLGIVVNDGVESVDSLASRTVVAELEALTGMPVLARLASGDRSETTARRLAQAVLARV